MKRRIPCSGQDMVMCVAVDHARLSRVFAMGKRGVRDKPYSENGALPFGREGRGRGER
ncbi:expressed unknown protein [Ectocarpus siliculosus]|uniref:Uncharacterized protein n=1 Tax=Ectocarpus siliculosus TaxID=2880 RepID=D7G333_ECTSI|nr:expressed unknown protein [Ectocarpus siliculosus]|eukprot:CBJ33476.1 expressed unknown protein [Ectocarpus siliculosus]